MDAAGIDDLRKRARAGDARAIGELGRRLVCGEDVEPSPLEGIRFLHDARRKGDGEASTVLAGMAAQGLFEPRNPSKALDLLLEGAARGWPGAQTQLHLLARAGGGDWVALRRAIDPAALAQAPPRRGLSGEPRIRVFENFATSAECDWLIERTRNALKPALIYHDPSDRRASDMRTNTECDLALNAFDVVTATVLERIASAAGVTRGFFEVAKVLHYAPGQEFTMHSDFFDPAVHVAEVMERGQRIVTFLVYLNDGYEGGETDFPKIGVRYKGRKGDALMFVNVAASGSPDLQTFHAGLPPTRGEKWLLSQWIRDKAINAFMTPYADAEPLDPEWRRKA